MDVADDVTLVDALEEALVVTLVVPVLVIDEDMVEVTLVEAVVVALYVPVVLKEVVAEVVYA